MRSAIIRCILGLIALSLLLACEGTSEATTASPTANSATTPPIAATAPAIREGTTAAAGTPARVGPKTIPPMPPAATPVALGVVGGWYSLSFGEAVMLPEHGLTIRFQAVTNDSRCPRNPTLYCTRAGEAVVEFAVMDDSASEVFSLTVPGLIDQIAQGSDYPSGRFNFQGYVVRIVSLMPYPGGASDTTTLSPTLRPTPTPPPQMIATLFIAVAP